MALLLPSMSREGNPSPKKAKHSKNTKQPQRQTQPIKLFVGGLTGDTTNGKLEHHLADLKDYFGRFAKIDVKPALDREQARAKADTEQRRKIFVGGLPKNLCDEKLEDYFSKFGHVQKCYVVKDAFTGKTRGFGFVIFGTQEAFEATLDASNHFIDGQEIHIKPAQAREEDMINEQEAEFQATPKESNKKKQIRQTKQSGQPYSESYSPNARNARGNQKRGNEFSMFETGNNFYGNEYYRDGDRVDRNQFHGSSFYPPNSYDTDTYGIDHRVNKQKHATAQFHQSAQREYHFDQGYTRQENYAGYQTSSNEFGGYAAHRNARADFANPNSPGVKHGSNQGFKPLNVAPLKQQQQNFSGMGQRSQISSEKSSPNFSQQSYPRQNYARPEKEILRPEMVNPLEEPHSPELGFSATANSYTQAFQGSYDQHHAKPDSPSNDRSPTHGVEFTIKNFNSRMSPQHFQQGPSSARSPGAYSGPMRSGSNQYNGLQQVTEKDSQIISEQQAAESADRDQQLHTRNPVPQSEVEGHLDDDFPEESEDLIDNFNYYVPNANHKEALQRVSPSNQPDSLRLINRDN